jgi:hypothetical protein
MTAQSDLFVAPWEESSAHCACCGNVTKTVWGRVSDRERSVAMYYVQWTAGSPDHHPNFDLIIGAWGDGTGPADRVLVSMLHLPGGVTVIDGAGRPPDTRRLCGRALRREEVIGTPLATNASALFDAVWLQDDRIAELCEWSAPK